MGASMVTMTLPLLHGPDPDWEAAARAIRCLRLEVLWASDDDLYPYEYWLDESGDLPGAEAAFVLLQTAQAELTEHAVLLRSAIEHGWPEELIAFDAPAHRVWITGGPSWGEPATDLTDPLIELAEAGITNAAGFEGYTSYASVPIDDRRFEFTSDEMRLVHFGIAAAHAAEQLTTLKHPALDASPLEWFNVWVAELDPPNDDQTDGGALLRFAARGLALSAWLADARLQDTQTLVAERARTLTTVADDGGLADHPRQRDFQAAVRNARTVAR